MGQYGWIINSSRRAKGEQTRILGISGSLRRGSYNTALLKAGAPLLDAGTELEIALLHGIPLYDGDLEAAEGLPQAVCDLKARVIACDGYSPRPNTTTAFPGCSRTPLIGCNTSQNCDSM